MSHESTKSALHDRFARSSLLGTCEGSEGRTLLWHPLNRTVVDADELVVEVIESFARPQTVRELARRFELSPELARELVGNLRDALVLHPAGQDEAMWIAQKHATRLRAPSTAALSRSAPVREPAAMPTPWVQGQALTVLELDGGDVLVTHVLGAPVRMTARLWALAQGAERAGDVQEVDARAREASLELLAAKRVLWPSHEAERTAIRERFVHEPGVSLMLTPLLANRWRTGYLPYDVTDVRIGRDSAAVALVGSCQLLAAAEPLEHIAASHGQRLEVHGCMLGEPLDERPWSLVVVSPTLLTARLYESAAAGDLEGMRSAAIELVARMDRVIVQIRQQTEAAIALVALSPPGLWASEIRPRVALRAIIADVNARLASGLLATGRGLLIDEQDLASEVGFRGVYCDDEFNAIPHHSPLSSWTYVDLPAEPEEAALTREHLEARQPPQSADQMDPAAGLAAAVWLRFLEARSHAPIEAIVFEPNELLWPGRLEDRERPYPGGGPHFYTADHYYFYAGVHEALVTLARRGVRLVCRSTCPPRLLRARWSYQSSLRNLVRITDVQLVTEHDRELAAVARQLGVPEERMLVIDLVSPRPVDAKVRWYEGDRWGLRRMLLTSPELAPIEGPAQRVHASSRAHAPFSPEDPVLVTPGIPTDEIAALVQRLLVERFGRSADALERTEDLRLLGLDSFGGVELMMSIQERVGILFDDSDFVATTVFSPAGLVQAAVRAARRDTVTPDEDRELLYGGLDFEGWCAQDVGTLIRAHAQRPRVPWIFKILRSPARHDVEYVTWRQLMERAGGYARRYRELGLRDGAVVMLVLPQGIELIAAFVGALLVGLVPSICAHPSTKHSREAFAQWFGVVVERSAARLVVTAPRWAELLRDELARHGSRCPIEVEVPPPTSELPSPLAPSSCERPLLLQHSSGTTGLKKAVLLSHCDVLSQIWELGHALECDEHDRVASWLPLYHDMGLVACLLLPLMCSLPTVMMSPFDWVDQPWLLLEQASEERATLCWLPNFAYQHIARRPLPAGHPRWDLTGLRAVIDCSEPVTAAALDAFYDGLAPHGLRYSALSSSYAMAEATFAITQSTPGRPPMRIIVERQALQRDGIVRVVSRTERRAAHTMELVSSGRPLPRALVEIVGTSGELLPEGRVGEIRVASDSLMRGYLHFDPTEPAPLRDGRFETGDLGFLHAGELFVTGRKKDLVIVGGHNVYPHEVEQAVSDLEIVRAGRVVAFGVFDEAVGTERLVVMAELVGDASEPTVLQDYAETIHQLVQGTFGVTVHEVRFVPARSLLKSTSGKLSRSRNRTLYLEGKE